MFRTFALAIVFACGAFAQAPPATPKDKLVADWKDIARKLTAMAEQFPEDKFDYKPAPEVRTFAQQLLHVAFWNEFVEKRAKGEKPDPKPNELPRERYKTRAAVAAVVKSAFDGAIAKLQEGSEAEMLQQLQLWSGFLEHNGEHYGQLVLYFRLNGLVPPESKR